MAYTASTDWTQTEYGSREAAITSLLPLVKKLALRVAYKVRIGDISDLIGDGNVAAIRAVDTFDASKGASLTSWAHTIIHGQILNGVRNRRAVPDRTMYFLRNAHAAADAFQIEHGRSITMAELEQLFPGYEKTAYKAFCVHPVSLDGFVPRALRDEGERGNGRFQIADPGAAVDAGLLAVDSRLELLDAVKTLPAREQSVITGRYFKNQTLQEIASEQHVSQQCISAIHLRAIKRLRTVLTPA